MKKIKHKDFYFKNRDVEEAFSINNSSVLVWEPSLNMYILKMESWKDVKAKYINTKEFMYYTTENYEKIFPEYDKTRHSCFVLRKGREAEWLGLKEAGVICCLMEKLPVKEVKRKINSGVYNIIKYSTGQGLQPTSVNTDSYIDIRDNKAHQQIYTKLINFKSKEDLYKQEKVRFKHGVLLYGSPGNGKTREICKIMEFAQKDDLVILNVPSDCSLTDLRQFREALSNQFVVIVLEELTERLNSRQDSLENILSFLDGEDSWEKCFVIATTNYPEDLPYNVIDRPGRFNLVIEFPNPTLKEKVRYLIGRGYTEDEARRIAKLTEGLSLDYLVQGITHSKLNNKSLEDYLRETSQFRNRVSGKFRGKIGIGREENSDDYADDFSIYDDDEDAPLTKPKIGIRGTNK